MESLFSWVSAGSDIRLLWLSIAIFVFWMTENQKIITIQIGALSVIFFINFGFIKKGEEANFIIINGDPIKQISEIEDIGGIWKKGIKIY